MAQWCGCATSNHHHHHHHHLNPLLVTANPVKPFISNSGKVKVHKKFQNSFVENPKKT